MSATSQMATFYQEVDEPTVDEAPRIAMRWRTELIAGLGKQADKFIILLDIDRVFASDKLLLATDGEVDGSALETPAAAATAR